MLRKVSLGLFVVLAACGSARVIQRTQSGGVIELSGDRGKAMEQANQEMASHCGPNNFTIVQEGEEAVGTDTFTREDTSDTARASRSGRTQTNDSTTQGQTSTRTATAWRVHYQCNGAGGPPPGPAGGPPPDPAGGPPPPADPERGRRRSAAAAGRRLLGIARTCSRDPRGSLARFGVRGERGPAATGSGEQLGVVGRHVADLIDAVRREPASRGRRARAVPVLVVLVIEAPLGVL